MVQFQPLDRTFAALADPTRRDILERLSGGSATISELAQPYEITLTGMKKHVQVLEAAELVTTRKVGRSRVCELGPQRLEDAAIWIAGWRTQMSERFDRLAELLERQKELEP